MCYCTCVTCHRCILSPFTSVLYHLSIDGVIIVRSERYHVYTLILHTHMNAHTSATTMQHTLHVSAVVCARIYAHSHTPTNTEQHGRMMMENVTNRNIMLQFHSLFLRMCVCDVYDSLCIYPSYYVVHSYSSPLIV